MPFLTGKNQMVEQVPGDITGLREDLAAWLQGQVPTGGRPGQYGIGAPVTPDAPSDFFVNQILGPTQDLFTQRREQALGQAKESAGTLTGSGFANTLGTATNRSLSEEQAILAQLINEDLTRTQQGNIFQQDMLSRLLQGIGTAGVGPPQMTHTPGFLDYLFQGAGAAAPIFAK